uniref:Uncharacterized protein n=1 Tax=Musa acuminata subsp. malaccensis TaxID=214687 RepID=A0A804JKG7_MUSAM
MTCKEQKGLHHESLTSWIKQHSSTG